MRRSQKTRGTLLHHVPASKHSFIDKVKLCLEAGKKGALVNCGHIYESIYDAMNQYFYQIWGGGRRAVFVFYIDDCGKKKNDFVPTIWKFSCCSCGLENGIIIGVCDWIHGQWVRSCGAPRSGGIANALS